MQEKSNKFLSLLKTRIQSFLEQINESKVDFFNKTQIARQNFYGGNAHSELGGDKLVRIFTNYPQLSPDWLLTGKGEMLRTPPEGEMKAPQEPAAAPQKVSVSKAEKKEDADLEKELREAYKKIAALSEEMLEQVKEIGGLKLQIERLQMRIKELEAEKTQQKTLTFQKEAVTVDKKG